MKHSYLALFGAFSLSACAQAPAPAAARTASAPATSNAASTTAAAPAASAQSRQADARARAAIGKLNAQARIDHVGPAPLKGFREVIVGGQVIYVTDDGKYVLQGSLYDVDAKQDMAAASLAGVRRELLATIPERDRIVFAPPAPKYTVAVFTDVECGYCRKLHEDIAEYNRQGISIQYLAFPRMGLGTPDYKKMVAVWCSADRKQALTDAKNGKAVNAPANCKSPVNQQYDIGQRVGLTGTPMIITAQGIPMPGYMPPKELRATLDRMAAQDAAQKPVMLTAPAAGA